jgi:nucleoside-triphosphatase THEP1
MTETTTSLFITGKAGTGKSTLLAHFSNNSDKKPVILAK